MKAAFLNISQEAYEKKDGTTGKSHYVTVFDGEATHKLRVDKEVIQQLDGVKAMSPIELDLGLEEGRYGRSYATLKGVRLVASAKAS